jgi:parallel beta-helix repeat protein
MVKLLLFFTVFIFLIIKVQAQEIPYYSENAKAILIPKESMIGDLTTLDKHYFEIRDNVCFVKVPIIVKGILRVNNNVCDVVKLYQTAYIKVTGEIYFENVKVSSYDPRTNAAINLTPEIFVKRPYITIDGGKIFSAKNSEFSHLGYWNKEGPGSTWGLAAYNLHGAPNMPSFIIENSHIHHNYFGVYTFNVRYGKIVNSEVHNNVEYGLDFHDYSDHFEIVGNELYRNGNHAIIFSKFCKNNIIMNNIIRDNDKFAVVKQKQQEHGTHGLMLHHFSDQNVIENNDFKNNRIGIYLQDSNNNIIRNNRIVDDIEEGIYLSTSNNNLIEGNRVVNPGKTSLYSYFSTNNFSNNYFEKGMHFKGDKNGKKYSVFVNETTYDDAKLQGLIDKEIRTLYIPYLGEEIEDKALIGRIFFLAGLLAIIFLVIFIEIFVLLFMRRGHGR